MKFIKNRLYLLFLVIFLGNCGDLELKNEYPEINEVTSEAEFKIILPEDHRKGLNWQLTQDYDKSHVRQINEVWHGNEKGIYFHLQALSIGQTTLTFVSRTYTDTADIKRFIVKIVKN